MKPGLSITLCALLAAGSPAQSEAPAGAPELAASEVLERMVQSYGNCTSYRDAGVVTTTFTHPDEPEKDTLAREHHSTKPFRTAFVRPGQFRFEYSEARRDAMSRYIVWQDGSDVRTWWDVHSGEEREGSLGMAIAGATGVSSGVAHTVPRLLLPLQVGGRSAAELANLERLSAESIDDAPCYRIKGLYAGRSTRVMWIDQASFLIRRIEAESDGEGYHAVEVTNYEPERDVEIGPGELSFDPPAAPPVEARKAKLETREAKLSYRLGLAMGYISAGAADKALPELEAVWNATSGDSRLDRFGQRGSLIETIGKLAAMHEATRVRFSAIFDELDTKIRKRGLPGDLPDSAWTDWVDLGRALKLDDRMLQLYFDRCSPTGSLEPGKDLHPRAFEALREILIARGLLAEAGRIDADPLKQAEIAYSLTPPPDEDGNDPGDWQDAVGQEVLEARANVSRRYALLLAAERTDEAESVARLMLERDDTTEARRSLVLACLHFGIPCAAIPTWLAEIRRRGGTVDDIEALMAAPPEAEPPARRAR